MFSRFKEKTTCMITTLYVFTFQDLVIKNGMSFVKRLMIHLYVVVRKEDTVFAENLVIIVYFPLFAYYCTILVLIIYLFSTIHPTNPVSP